MCVHFHSLNHSSTVSQLFVFWKRGSYRIIFLSHVHENEIFHGRIFYYNDILIFMILRSMIWSDNVVIWFKCKVFGKDLYDTRVIQSHIIFAQWKTNMFMRYVCIDENSYLHSSIVKNHKHIYDRYRFQMKELREISLRLDYYHAKFICFCCRETIDVLLDIKSCTKSFFQYWKT